MWPGPRTKICTPSSAVVVVVVVIVVVVVVVGGGGGGGGGVVVVIATTIVLDIVPGTVLIMAISLLLAILLHLLDVIPIHC